MQKQIIIITVMQKELMMYCLPLYIMEIMWESWEWILGITMTTEEIVVKNLKSPDALQ